jgi:hypothetical protein
MPRRWCLGVTVVVSTAMCALPASAQQPSLPVTVPQVTVPPVTVPPVTVPPVTVPPTPVTPGVTTPPVQTPPVSTPSVSTSSGPASGSGQGGGSGSGQSNGGQPSSAGQSGAGQASGTGQSGAGQASGTGESGAGQSGAGQANGAGANGSGPSSAGKSGSAPGDDPGNAPTRLRGRDRELRRAVLGHEACLGQIPGGERRVLTLRAGVGMARTRSRGEVQRMTGLRRTRVVALERRGLKRLRALAQAGGCAATSSATPAGVEQTAGAALSHRADGDRALKLAVLGDREFSSAATPPKAPAGSSDAGRPLLHAPDSAVDLAPALLFLLLAGFVYAAVREARRSA